MIIEIKGGVMERLYRHAVAAMITIFVVIFLGVIVLWHVAVWDECRDAGHSVIYCARMVTR